MPGLRVQLVLDEASRDGLAVLVFFAFANKFADEKGVGAIAAVERDPGEAEGGGLAGGPLVVTALC